MKDGHLEHGGTHWVCFYKDFYFDPFGTVPNTKIIKGLGIKRYNSYKYQDINENICGHYCLSFLSRMSNGEKLEDVLTDFSSFKK